MSAIYLPNAPQVSVLMSVYNERPDFLERSMSSILNQTFQEFEFIVIDDGSDSPATIEAIDQWKKSDPRVRIIRQSNKGLTKSLNLGISAARGTWIARQDSDDWSDPGRLAGQLALASQDHNVGLVGSWFYTVDIGGQKLALCKMPDEDAVVRKTIAQKNPFCHGAMMFRRDHALAVNGYREFLAVGQDYDFFWRLIDLRCKFAAVEKPLYYLRYNPKGVSATRGHLQKEAAWIIRKLAEIRRQGLDESKALDETLRKAKSEKLQKEFHYSGRLLAAHKIYAAGEHRIALKMILKCIIEHPFSGEAYYYIARKLYLRSIEFLS